MNNENNPDNKNFNLPPFYSGQKIVCVMGGGWVCQETNEDNVGGPVKNAVCQVINCYIGTHGLWYANLVGYSNLLKDNGRDGYDCSSFRPLQEQTFPLISYSKVLEEVKVGGN